MVNRAKSVVLLAAGFSVAIPGLALAQPAFEASDDPGTVVIQLAEYVGIEGDDTPLLRIYGGGRVQVHFPVYMTRAGDYSMQLMPGELDDLLQSAVAGGLVEFNANSVRSDLASARQTNREAALLSGAPVALSWQSDPTLRVIDIQLVAYTAADGRQQQNIQSRIAWAGARNDVLEFPGVTALQSLAAFEDRLLELTTHPDLARINR